MLLTGRGRSTRYAVRRAIAGVSTPIPVYELRPPGEAPRHMLNLHPVQTDGFFAEGLGGEPSEFFNDLPWFLNDLRPSGFLGRLIPLRHPELGLPPDIRMWSADHVLRFITLHGWNLPGAFIVGEPAYLQFLSHSGRPPDVVPANRRDEQYPLIASEVLSYRTAGSSAAGEQPKFLATRCAGTHLTQVLVKFSPGPDDSASRRVADLLVAEHLALETLRRHGVPCAESAILAAGGRTFLEVERFDRFGPANRRGLVSLENLDAAFVGSDQSSWGSSVEHLVRQDLADESDLGRARLLELFGRLIGNTDMHFGNLSFHLDGTRPAGLASPYDMLPMHYFPRQGEVPTGPFEAPVLLPSRAGVVQQGIAAAVEFWERVANDQRISPAFRKLAAANSHRVADLTAKAALLPAPALT